MGYTTEFKGKFKLKFKDETKRKKVTELVNGLANTRRMQRDMRKLENFTEKEIKDFGDEGEFYFPTENSKYYNFAGQNRKDPSILNYNKPPKNQPGLWLQWVITGNILEWNGGEKFYYYTEWLNYLIKKIFEPNNVEISGTITYQGEEYEDVGKIEIVNGKVYNIKI